MPFSETTWNKKCCLCVKTMLNFADGKTNEAVGINSLIVRIWVKKY